MAVPGRDACCDPPQDGCVPVAPREEYRFDVRRVDTGEVLLADVEWMRGLPAGAMYWQEMSERRKPTSPDDYSDFTAEDLQRLRTSFADAPHMYPRGASPSDPTLPARQPSHLFTDGPQLEVVTPGGLWNIDSRASNCGSPYDYEHRCWVRHGDPPVVTVDKAGSTCSAGAGSIQCGSYHGLLQNGVLT